MLAWFQAWTLVETTNEVDRLSFCLNFSQKSHKGQPLASAVSCMGLTENFQSHLTSTMVGYTPNSTWLVASRLDTTRHVRRVQQNAFGCVELVGFTRRARRVERVVSDRDATWRVKWNLGLCRRLRLPRFGLPLCFRTLDLHFYACWCIVQLYLMLMRLTCFNCYFVRTLMLYYVSYNMLHFDAKYSLYRLAQKVRHYHIINNCVKSY